MSGINQEPDNAFALNVEHMEPAIGQNVDLHATNEIVMTPAQSEAGNAVEVGMSTPQNEDTPIAMGDLHTNMQNETDLDAGLYDTDSSDESPGDYLVKRRKYQNTGDNVSAVNLPDVPPIPEWPPPNTTPEFWTGRFYVTGDDAVSHADYSIMRDRVDMHMHPPHYSYAFDQIMRDVDAVTPATRMMLVPVPCPMVWRTKNGDMWYGSIKRFQMNIFVYLPGGGSFVHTWFDVQYKNRSTASGNIDEDRENCSRRFRKLWPKVYVASWDLNVYPGLNGLNWQCFDHPDEDSLVCSTQVIPSPRLWRDAHGRLMFPAGCSFKFYIKINTRPSVWFELPNARFKVEHMKHFSDATHYIADWPFIYWDPFNPGRRWYKVWNTLADEDQIPFNENVTEEEKKDPNFVKVNKAYY